MCSKHRSVAELSLCMYEDLCTSNSGGTLFSVLICYKPLAVVPSLKRGGNSKWEPNKLKSTRSCSRGLGFRHAESKSGLYFGLSLFLKDVSVILCRNSWELSPVFWNTSSFWLKLGSQVSQNMHHYIANNRKYTQFYILLLKNNREKSKLIIVNQFETIY